MSLLFPLYLLGAAAIALPIYLHLKRRPPKDSVEFSSLMFLEPTRTVHVKRRNKLENIALLILRSLAIIGLAFMFSRPFLRGDSQLDRDGTTGRHVVLLDASASMQRDGLWKQALEKTREALPDSPKATAAVFTFDSAPKRVFDFEEWTSWADGQRNERAKGQLDKAEPGWGKTNPGAAIVRALGAINDADADDATAAGPHRITLVSDLQKSASLEALRSIDWPENVILDLVVLETRKPGNAGLQWVRSASGPLPNVRITNSADSAKSSFELDNGITVDVPPGESRITSLAEGTDLAQLKLVGDPHPFDNTLHYAPVTHRTLRIHYSGKQDTELARSPFYYIFRAFPETDTFRATFSNDADAATDFAILPKLSAVERPEAMRPVLENGLTALAVLDDAKAASNFISLTGIEDLAIESGPERDYSMLARIDFEASALTAFNDPKVRDFTKIRFWKYRRIDPNSIPESAQIIASYDTGDPAWIRFPVGRGALVVLTSGWTPTDSQLARSSKFLPLLYSVFGAGGLASGVAMPGFVDEPITIAEASTDGPVTVTHPDGTRSEVKAPFQFAPGQPGIYKTSAASFAVNVPPSETETAPHALSEFEAFGIRVANTTEGLAAALAAQTDEEARARQLDSEREEQQKIWQWIVLGVFLMLIVETWLAGRPPRADNETEGESEPEPASP